MRHRQLLDQSLEKIQRWRKEGHKVDELVKIIVFILESKQMMLAIFLSLLILFSGGLGGMFLYSDVYDDIQSNIVTTLCLSCIKMDPITRLEYTFETADGQPHPFFILENLTEGPVFLAFRKDVCAGCDIMEPIIQDIFNVEFEKEELFYRTVEYDDSNVNFVHINLQHSSGETKDSFFIYDKDHRGGVPMFVVITLGNNSGQIEPYYTTAYGTLGLGSNEASKAFLRNMMQDAIDLYNQNQEKYQSN